MMDTKSDLFQSEIKTAKQVSKLKKQNNLISQTLKIEIDQ